MSPLDLSLSAIFQQATGVVQAVLILLLCCSILCWAIILEKAVILVGLHRQARAFEAAARMNDAASLGEAGLAREIAAGGQLEWRDIKPSESEAERRDRIERAMRDILFARLMQAEARVPYLATIGSASPFIGLFGTVWGIMHSFAAISAANDTSLAVVAPGIAEALSTTAIGLLAAIPAAIAYNKLASDFTVLTRRFSLAAGQMVRRMATPQHGQSAQRMAK